MAFELLDMGESGVGYLNAAIGVGALIGSLAALSLAGMRRLGPPFIVGIVLWGVPLALIGLTSEPALAIVLLGVVGANSLVNVAVFTLIQRAVPDDVLARVFGVIQFLWIASFGIGGLLIVPLIDWLGPEGALIVAGAFLPALVLLVGPRLLRLDAAAEAPAAGALAPARDPDLRAASGDPARAPRDAARSAPRRAGHGRRSSGRLGRPLLRRRRGRDRGHGRRGTGLRARPGRVLRGDRAPARHAADGDGDRPHTRRPLRARARGLPRRGHRPRAERAGGGGGRGERRLGSFASRRTTSDLNERGIARDQGLGTATRAPDEFESRLRQFVFERSEESRALRVGEKEISEQAAIVARYADLFTGEQLEALGAAQEAEADEDKRERLYRLHKTASRESSRRGSLRSRTSFQNAELAARVVHRGEELPLRSATRRG